jgi:hypothetical protein
MPTKQTGSAHCSGATEPHSGRTVCGKPLCPGLHGSYTHEGVELAGQPSLTLSAMAENAAALAVTDAPDGQRVRQHGNDGGACVVTRPV